MTKRDQCKRWEDAVKSLKEIQKEIAPFTKKVKMSLPETRGKWQIGK